MASQSELPGVVRSPLNTRYFAHANQMIARSYRAARSIRDARLAEVPSPFLCGQLAGLQPISFLLPARRVACMRLLQWRSPPAGGDPDTANECFPQRPADGSGRKRFNLKARMCTCSVLVPGSVTVAQASDSSVHKSSLISWSSVGSPEVGSTQAFHPVTGCQVLS